MLVGKIWSSDVVGRGWRSSEVIGDQTLKTFVTHYLKIESMDSFHTSTQDVLYKLQEHIGCLGWIHFVLEILVKVLYIKNKNQAEFDSQSAFEVTSDHSLKTL